MASLVILRLTKPRKGQPPLHFVLFLCFGVFLFLRTVDGHGAVQTVEVRLISFAIWAIFYIGLMAIEWLVYVIVRRCAK